MPVIQVYKHNGVMIPIDNAKKSRAYQCPWTGELHSTKQSYLRHLKKYRTDVLHKNARHRRWLKKAEDLWSQPSFDDIIKWLETNSDFLIYNASINDFIGKKQHYQKIMDSFIFTVTKLSLDYNETVSNSHSAPVGKKTNWGGREVYSDGSTYPRGFPGWSGLIDFRSNHSIPTFASNIFKNLRIHTGSGGGGLKNGHYEVRFFIEDWPGLYENIKLQKSEHDKLNTFNALKNKRVEPFTNSYRYTADKK